MTPIAGAITIARRSLDGAGLRFALVGGFAVSVRSEPRFTQDVDLAVAVEDDTQAEAIVRGLLADGHDLAATVEQDAVGRLATARFRLVGGDELDLLFSSSGIEPEVVADATTLEILPGVAVPVASVGHLIALKLLSRSPSRPNDDADLRALAAVADDRDREAARAAVGLIADRGYDRGRDLGALLAELVAG